MKIGVISRIIGVPPTGPNAVLTYTDSTPDEYDSLFVEDQDNLTPTLYSTGVKISETPYYIYLKFDSDSDGELYVVGWYDWDLVDPLDLSNDAIDQVVVAGNNCIRLNNLTTGTHNAISLQIKSLQGWYYTMSNSLAVPEFLCVGYLLTTFPAAVGYSLSKIEQSATKCIEISRSSDGYTTTQIIGFSGGSVDEAAIEAYVGTGSTDYGVIVTVFNQQNDGSSNNLLPTGIIPAEYNDSDDEPGIGSYTSNNFFPGLGDSSEWRPFIVKQGVIQRMTFGGVTYPCIRCEGWYRNTTNTTKFIDNGRQMYVDNPTTVFNGKTYIRSVSLIRGAGNYRNSGASTADVRFRSANKRFFSVTTDLGEVHSLYNIDPAAIDNNDDVVFVYKNGGSTSVVPFYLDQRSAASGSLNLYNSLSGAVTSKLVVSSNCATGEANFYGTDSVGNSLDSTTTFTPQANFGATAQSIFIPGLVAQSNTLRHTSNCAHIAWHTFVLYNDDTYDANKELIYNIVGS